VHRRELFPLDRVLVARMIAAAIATPLVVAAALVLLVLIAPLKLLIGAAIASGVGLVLAIRERRRRPAPTELTAERAPELHAIVERLCVVGDLPKPRLVLEHERQPNSWIVSLGRGHSQLHVTEGLLECLEPSELEAVIGHELAHVAHRDAAVMTVVGGPGSVLMSGGARVARAGVWPLQLGGLVAIVIGWLGSLGTRILSRYREFAADAGAVALTGNPAALASALVKVSDGLVVIPKADLREAAARDAFHLLPTGESKGPPLPASHPSLRARIDRLNRIEARLQAARGASG
jgi:heat shock protein HtpX